MNNAFDKDRFRPDSRDPEGSALTFFTDIATELWRSRGSHVITDSSTVLIIQVLHKLEPVSVREAVRNAYEYWSREEKSSFHFFKTSLLKGAVESAKYSKSNKLPSKQPTRDEKNDKSSNSIKGKHEGEKPKAGSGKMAQ